MIRDSLRAGRGLALAAVIGLAACGGDRPIHYGKPVALDQAVRLSEVLAADPVQTPRPVVVSGRVSQVCQSAGCWMVLDDAAGGKVYQLYVDFKPAATFTVPVSIAGHPAVVAGKLVGTAPDLVLNATGLVVDPPS